MQINLDFLKDEKVGRYSIETIKISEKEAEFQNIRCIINNRPEQMVQPGTFKVLKENGSIWMSNTLMEVKTHQEAIKKAKGKVLVAGLGLGMYLTAIKDKLEVEEIVVVEKSKDIISLTGKYFKDNKKIKIVNTDIFKYQTKEKFDFIWLDIWQDICADNLKEMKKLKNKFKDNSTDILCWSENILSA